MKIVAVLLLRCIEVNGDWDQFFGTLGAIGFGARDETIMTVCVFAWEERARESSRVNRERIEQAVKSWI